MLSDFQGGLQKWEVYNIIILTDKTLPHYIVNNISNKKHDWNGIIRNGISVFSSVLQQLEMLIRIYQFTKGHLSGCILP